MNSGQVKSQVGQVVKSSQKNKAKVEGSAKNMIYKVSDKITGLLFVNPDWEVLKAAYQDFNPEEEICPSCKSGHTLSYYTHYHTNLTSEKVSIPRYICSSCNKTHALLQAPLFPHGRYSYTFICYVLLDYAKREETVRNIADLHLIAVSTLYDWKHRIEAHMKHCLGVVRAQSTSLEKFLKILIRAASASIGKLGQYYETYARPFLSSLPKKKRQSEIVSKVYLNCNRPST